MAIYVPIVMYGLRLFIVVLQELHCLPNCLHVFMNRVIGCYHVTKFRFSTPSSFGDSYIYCLRLFIVVLQKLHCLLQCLLLLLWCVH